MSMGTLGRFRELPSSEKSPLRGQGGNSTVGHLAGMRCQNYVEGAEITMMGTRGGEGWGGGCNCTDRYV